MKLITLKPIFILLFISMILVGSGFSQDANGKMEKKYQEAKAKFQAQPNEENTIWYGRRTAYLGKYKEAIKIFSNGLQKFPKSYKLYRHRGHRYITTREFAKAIADFKKAATLIKGKPLEMEPDGLPNALNIPLSNTQFNIFYHFGLAYYLRGEYGLALPIYKECLIWSKNDDSIVATTHWLYMTLRRMGRKEEAKRILPPLKKKMTIVEDFDYFQLVLMYKGIKTVEELEKTAEDYKNAALWYGIGNWYLYNGKEAKAKEIFTIILEHANLAAFGSIATEQELENSR
jgi:tetratricopeptide (TPR) repeat protein